MNDYFIFSDASFDPNSGRGVGATLIVTSDLLMQKEGALHFEIQTKRIDGENIARLEFLSAIGALKEWKLKFQNRGHLEKTAPVKITLIIDCKAIENILQRRERLERDNFFSKKTSQPLANADLYREFFILYDELLPEIVWVKGHSARQSRDRWQEVFSLVDKMARKRLREICAEKDPLG